MDENERKQQTDLIIEKVKALVKEGNVTRILLKRNGETLINIPVNVGLLGAVIGLTAAPFALLAAGIAAFGLKCTVEIVKKDGTVEKVNEAVDEAEASIKDIVAEVKAAKEKVEEAKKEAEAAEEAAPEEVPEEEE